MKAQDSRTAGPVKQPQPSFLTVSSASKGCDYGIVAGVEGR